MSDLTTQQEAFAQEYVLNGYNASEAYRKVTGSKAKDTSINETASRWLVKVGSRVAALQAIAAKLATERFEITADRVLQEVAAIAFYDATDYFTWDDKGVTIKPSDELTKIQRKAVTTVTQTTGNTSSIKLEMGNKLGALDKLGKHFNLFKEQVTIRHEHTIIENAARDLDSRLARFLDAGEAEPIPLIPH
jgi:phage terminase small subunit